MPEKENKLDVRKVYEAIARIIGAREGIEITVKSVEQIQEEETA